MPLLGSLADAAMVQLERATLVHACLSICTVCKGNVHTFMAQDVQCRPSGAIRSQHELWHGSWKSNTIRMACMLAGVPSLLSSFKGELGEQGLKLLHMWNGCQARTTCDRKLLPQINVRFERLIPVSRVFWGTPIGKVFSGLLIFWPILRFKILVDICRFFCRTTVQVRHNACKPVVCQHLLEQASELPMTDPHSEKICRPCIWHAA